MNDQRPDDRGPDEVPRNAAPARRGTRRIQWLAGIVLALIAGYTALWFFLASKLEDGVERALAQSPADVACQDRDVRGYPFRLGLFCERTAAKTTEGTLNAGAFRSAAQIYRPGLVISELDGPFAFDGRAAAIEADWESARASTRFGTTQLQLGTVELRDATLRAAPAGGEPFEATLAGLLASVRPNGQALDLALQATAFDAAPVAGRDAPPVDLTLDATLSDAAAALAYDGTPLDSLRGRTIDLRRLALNILEGGRIDVSGEIEVDAAGLADGTVDLAFTDLEATLAALRALAPEIGPQLDAIGPVLAQAGGGLLGDVLGAVGGDAAAEPVTPAGTTRLSIVLDGGRARVGIFPLGQIPPLP